MRGAAFHFHLNIIAFTFFPFASVCEPKHWTWWQNGSNPNRTCCTLTIEKLRPKSTGSQRLDVCSYDISFDFFSFDSHVFFVSQCQRFWRWVFSAHSVGKLEPGIRSTLQTQYQDCEIEAEISDSCHTFHFMISRGPPARVVAQGSQGPTKITPLPPPLTKTLLL